MTSFTGRKENSVGWLKTESVKLLSYETTGKTETIGKTQLCEMSIMSYIKNMTNIQKLYLPF